MVYCVCWLLSSNLRNAYSVGMLTSESVAKTSEESASALHNLVYSLVLFVSARCFRMDNNRVASAVQCFHLIIIVYVALILAHFGKDKQRVLAFGIKQESE